MVSRILLALAALFLPTAGYAQTDPIAWIQFVTGGEEVRAVVAEACPTIEFDGVAKTMAERASSSAAFLRVCSLALPPTSKSVRVRFQDGAIQAFPALVSEPRRILILGDTGCRIKGTFVQACNDPSAWPFAGLARAAADLKPDLVIHLGDYLYRESPCPPGNAGCASSPYGDNWESWNADFFAPAAPLLAAAPWLVIRGNHEECSRAGAGFLRLLGPAVFDEAAPCAEHLAPFAVNAGSQKIVVMDNASASDTSVDDKSAALYRQDFDALKGLSGSDVGSDVWLAAHRPIWAAIKGPLGIPIGGNATLIAASGDLSAFAAVSLMLSGHIHTFEAINYTAKVPPQIVAGHGGDNLDPTPADLGDAIFQGQSGVHVKDGLSVGGFGFLMLTRDSDSGSWTVQLYDSTGEPGRQCEFASRRISCPTMK